MNIIKEQLEDMYLRFGIKNEEVLKLSQELDKIIFKIQYNRLIDYNKNKKN